MLILFMLSGQAFWVTMGVLPRLGQVSLGHLGQKDGKSNVGGRLCVEEMRWD